MQRLEMQEVWRLGFRGRDAAVPQQPAASLLHGLSSVHDHREKSSQEGMRGTRHSTVRALGIDVPWQVQSQRVRRTMGATAELADQRPPASREG